MIKAKRYPALALGALALGAFAIGLAAGRIGRHELDRLVGPGLRERLGRHQ